MALYKFFSQDGPTLPRKIMCESCTLTHKDFEKANAEVKRSIKRGAAKPQKVFPPTPESMYSCICHGLEHKSLVETFPWLRFRSSHFSRTTCGLPPHDDVIKICMRDCQSPTLNSANIYLRPLGGHFAKYISHQIFWLYSSHQNRMKVAIRNLYCPIGWLIMCAEKWWWMLQVTVSRSALICKY